MKLAVAVVVASATMAASAGSAAAFSIALSGGPFTLTSNSVTFSDSGGLVRVSCAGTLEGTLDTGPIPLARGSAVGAVDGGAFDRCSGGGGAPLVVQPWDVEVESVQGTLPNGATGILLRLVDFQVLLTVTILGMPVSCLYAGPLGISLSLTGTNPYRTGTTATGLGSSLSRCPVRRSARRRSA